MNVLNVSLTAACHSQSMRYDIHGAISVGVGSVSDVMDERPSRGSSECGQPFSSAGTLPLAPAAYSQDAAQTLQSMGLQAPEQIRLNHV